MVSIETDELECDRISIEIAKSDLNTINSLSQVSFTEDNTIFQGSYMSKCHLKDKGCNHHSIVFVSNWVNFCVKRIASSNSDENLKSTYGCYFRVFPNGLDSVLPKSVGTLPSNVTFIVPSALTWSMVHNFRAPVMSGLYFATFFWLSRGPSRDVRPSIDGALFTDRTV